MQLGANKVDKVYLGATEVDKIYLGANQVYSKAWTLAQITTSAWYDAADAPTITDSAGKVSIWSDKSGNAENGTQASITKQPLTNSATINGLNSIYFDGLSTALTTSLQQLTNATIYIIANAESKGINQDNNVLGAATSYNSGGAFISTQEYGSGNASEVYFYTTFINASQKNYNGTPYASATVSFAPAIRQHYANNVTTENLPYTLGNRNATNTLSGFKGSIGEVIICDGIHDEATRQLVEGYLAWKWGLVTKLPYDHPYRFDGRKFGYYELWQPDRMTTSAWFDAYDEDTIQSSAGKVSQWSDKSGNDNHVVQASVSRQPMLGTWNGKPSIEIITSGSSGDMLTTGVDGAVIGTTDDFTIIGVIDGTSVSRGADLFGSGWSLSFNDANVSVVLTSGGASGFFTNPSDGSLMLGMLEQGVSLKAASYGGAFVTTALSKTDLRTSTRYFEIGTANGLSRPGHISELVVMNSLVSDSEREKLEGYLAWKWGLVTKLPYGHPYRWDGTIFGGPVLWQPNQITTRAWFDAYDEDTIQSSAGKVSIWSDKSGNAENATQASSTKQPATGTRGLNGLNVIDFDSSSKDNLYVSSVDYDDTDETMMFIVGGYDAMVSYEFMALGRGSSKTGVGVLGASWRNIIDGVSTIGPVNDLNPHVFSLCLEGGTDSEFLVDGNVVNSTTGVYNIESQALDIGSQSDLYHMNGFIGEIIITDFCTESYRQNIEGYLAWKWNLEANLPALHPYKNSPPTV